MIEINNTHLKEMSDFSLTSAAINALEKFRSIYKQLPMFEFNSNLKKVQKFEYLLEKIKDRFTDIVVLGTGGSSLGAQVLCKFSPLEDRLRIHFFDNIDPLTFKHFWEKNRLERTLFLIISKSGTTPETLTQAIISVSRVIDSAGMSRVSEHFIVITEPKNSPLKKMAEYYGFLCIDHDKGIGGRFSVLSIVGLLPAMLMGVPISRVIAGADSMFRQFLKDPENHSITQSVVLMDRLCKARNITQTVLLTYVDQLEPLGRWFRQLWAESLGKNGLGTTPINAIGTVDQHSQLQLYLDGPKDKLFTVITHPLNGGGDKVSSDVSAQIGFEFMGNKTMGDLMDAEQRATIQVLQHNNCPTRVIELSDVSPETVGELMTQFIIETLLTADILGVNCFDQPAVEQGKNLVKEILNIN